MKIEESLIKKYEEIQKLVNASSKHDVTLFVHGVKNVHLFGDPYVINSQISGEGDMTQVSVNANYEGLTVFGKSMRLMEKEVEVNEQPF